MITLALALTGLLAAHGSVSHVVHCAQLDPRLTYCPPVQAPRITELQRGFVILSITVLPDGSVKSVYVLSSDSLGQWNHAAINTVSHWRYKPSSKTEVKSQRLDFNFSEG